MSFWLRDSVIYDIKKAADNIKYDPRGYNFYTEPLIDYINHPYTYEDLGEIDQQNGQTALIYACRYKMPNVALALIDSGESNPGHIDNNGKNAYDYAQTYTPDIPETPENNMDAVMTKIADITRWDNRKALPMLKEGLPPQMTTPGTRYLFDQGIERELAQYISKGGRKKQRKTKRTKRTKKTRKTRNTKRKTRK